MNKVLLIGRITQTPNVFKTKAGDDYVRTTIAIAREFSKDKESDFINLTIFGKTSDYAKKYVGKGDLVSIEGTLQTSSWKDGDEYKSSWSVVVNNIRHLETRDIVLARSGNQEVVKKDSFDSDEPWDLDL